LTAASCPKKDFYKGGKKGSKKGSKKAEKKAEKKQQERQQNSLFLNLSCCCLETGLKPV